MKLHTRGAYLRPAFMLQRKVIVIHDELVYVESVFGLFTRSYTIDHQNSYRRISVPLRKML